MDDEDENVALRRRVAELEAELARARALPRVIVARIPAIMYVKDREGRYVFGSRWGFELFGVDADRAVGKTDVELFPEALAARFRASDLRVLEGEPVAAESYAVPSARGPRHFTGVRFAIPGPDGEPEGVCGFAVDVTERVELARELERLATTDPLTSLANRRRFDHHLGSELARAARSHEPLSLLLCDVDRFKEYNDRYGHQEGDACLAAVARALERAVRRPADLAARYGGEEFAVILPNTTSIGAARIATRARALVRDLAMRHEGNDGRGVVTLSIGAATVLGPWSAAEVLALADRALYDAKTAGRDRHVAVEDERAPASQSRRGE
jgi:diguanylate cyclase (GGDEF)-like protein/PAS domain S-box-containing protein